MSCEGGGAARAAWLAGGAVQEGVQSRPEYMLGGIAGHEPKEIWRAVAARILAALMVAAPRTKGCVVADIRSAEDDAIKALGPYRFDPATLELALTASPEPLRARVRDALGTVES